MNLPIDPPGNEVAEYLAEARLAHARREWAASYGAFVRVDGIGSMALDDLDAFAGAAWRHGRDSEAARLTERVYRGLTRTDPAGAAMKAAELGVQWRARGHVALARQWTDRARMLLVSVPVGPVHGCVAYLDAVTEIAGGEAPVGAATALRVNATATGDVTSGVLARAVDGLVALLEARLADGQRLLDEILLPMIDERVRLEWAGDVYRTALDVGGRLADHDHVMAWSSALHGWRARAGIR